jgi:hypothetical protein
MADDVFRALSADDDTSIFYADFAEKCPGTLIVNLTIEAVQVISDHLVTGDPLAECIPGDSALTGDDDGLVQIDGRDFTPGDLVIMRPSLIEAVRPFMRTDGDWSEAVIRYGQSHPVVP